MPARGFEPRSPPLPRASSTLGTYASIVAYGPAGLRAAPCLRETILGEACYHCTTPTTLRVYIHPNSYAAYSWRGNRSDEVCIWRSAIPLLTLYKWNRQWREKQAEEIQAREEAAKERRKETISKAEAAIDEFYEKYAAKKERNIRENK